MSNLVRGLTAELLRVKQIYNQYIKCADMYTGTQNTVILLTADMIKQTIDTALRAQDMGDVVQMIRSIRELQEIKG